MTAADVETIRNIIRQELQAKDDADAVLTEVTREASNREYLLTVIARAADKLLWTQHSNTSILLEFHSPRDRSEWQRCHGLLKEVLAVARLERRQRIEDTKSHNNKQEAILELVRLMFECLEDGDSAGAALTNERLNDRGLTADFSRLDWKQPTA